MVGKSPFLDDFMMIVFTRFFILAMLFSAQAENSNFSKIGLTLPDKKVVKMLLKKSTMHLTKVLEFSSQYFPRFMFPNRPI